MTVQLCLMMMMMMMGGIFQSLPFCGVVVESPLHTLCFLLVRMEAAKCWTPDGRLKLSWLMMDQCCLFSLRTEVFRAICSRIDFLDSKQPFCCHLCASSPSPNDILDAGIQFYSHLSFLFSVVSARIHVHFRSHTNSPEKHRALLKTGG